MTSRPAPGTHGSGAPLRTQVRRLSKPASALPPVDCIDPTLEDERPPAHNGASDARPPPRGRPQLFYSTVASDGIELPIHSFPYQPTMALPAPPRPGSVLLRDASQQRRVLPGGTGVKDTPKLAAPEAVVVPVHLPGGKAADVFPWTGNNAEDTLSETLVKGGISNKPQIMNETNTARPSLWSNLKNKSGLTTLSTLFVAVLEKRQQSGRLQTSNTFKPPPRLTLRDSTREGWLHDLANPTVSLRRLSRTIPHGLTGKVLLEQCLNKNIPLPRALWLAKCVGINELRAHKRKGQAGTVTWGRGWTSSVEQFLDSVISTIGTGDWKPRITYA
jgi:mediator of RNA polymerase II transcription subunit 12